jgi:hypothetical protein
VKYGSKKRLSGYLNVAVAELKLTPEDIAAVKMNELGYELGCIQKDCCPWNVL